MEHRYLRVAIKNCYIETLGILYPMKYFLCYQLSLIEYHIHVKSYFKSAKVHHWVILGDQKLNVNWPIWLFAFLKSCMWKREEARLQAPSLLKLQKQLATSHMIKKIGLFRFWSPTNVTMRAYDNTFSILIFFVILMTLFGPLLGWWQLSLLPRKIKEIK